MYMIQFAFPDIEWHYRADSDAVHVKVDLHFDKLSFSHFPTIKVTGQKYPQRLANRFMSSLINHLFATAVYNPSHWVLLIMAMGITKRLIVYCVMWLELLGSTLRWKLTKNVKTSTKVATKGQLFLALNALLSGVIIQIWFTKCTFIAKT